MNVYEDRLITKIIQEKRLPKFVNASHFGERNDLFSFIETYNKSYNAIPSFDLLLEEGFDFKEQEVKDAYEYYEDKVLEESMKNKMSNKTLEMVSALKTGDLEKASNYGFDIYKEFTKKSNVVSYNDYSHLEETYNYRNTDHGKIWQFKDFSSIHNNITNLYGGDFHVIAGRPKLGKTFIATAMCMDLFKQGAKVGIASAEMSLKKMEQRCDMILTGLSPNYFESGSLTPRMRGLVKKKREDAMKAGGNIYFVGFESADDMYSGTVWDLAQYVKDYELDVLLIDSLYAYNTVSKKFVPMHEKTTELVRDAVSITRRYKCVTIATTQFNRDGDKKKGSAEGKHVAYSDSFLQYCDSLIGIHSDQAMESTGKRQLNILAVREGSPGERLIDFKINQVETIIGSGDSQIIDDRDLEESDDYEFNY